MQQYDLFDYIIVTILIVKKNTRYQQYYTRKTRTRTPIHVRAIGMVNNCQQTLAPWTSFEDKPGRAAIIYAFELYRSAEQNDGMNFINKRQSCG